MYVSIQKISCSEKAEKLGEKQNEINSKEDKFLLLQRIRVSKGRKQYYSCLGNIL